MESRSVALKKKKSVSCNKDDDNAGAMVVAVRIRPLSSKEINAGHKSCCTAINGNTIAIKKEGNAAMYLKSQQGSVNEYCFDSVFDKTHTQYDVYEKTTKKFIADVIEGFNVTVFAYGATGAGKTHTMMGNARVDESQGNSAEAGIIPNALSDVFKIISEKRSTALPGQTWSVIVSFMEVYNEQVYDLLESTDKILSVREDTERGVVEVAGRTKKVVESAEDVLNLLQLGNTNRKTEATMANQVSSRSHAVLQLAIEANFRNSSGQEISTTSTLSMIDLAGSERASATNNRGSRLQEGANINKSLLALANCINALAGNSASGKQMNVKYRDSKLTHLLKSSLQGKCKLVMIANINPSHITFEDSHNSLKYANRAKNIKVNPLVVSEVNKDSTWVEREMKLKAENAELRARIAELEATVAALQSVHAMLPDDFDIKEQEDVIDCSMDCSLVNNSTADVSLPVICDIPPIKSSKTPQIKLSASKKTPYSDRQRKLCSESREELVDFVEANCSLTSTSFCQDDEVEKMMNVVHTRQKSLETVSKKRTAPESKSQQAQPQTAQPASKKVKLEPMSSSLKDRIAELSKITMEQQKMFDNLLQDQNFVDQLDNSSHDQGAESMNYSSLSSKMSALNESHNAESDDIQQSEPASVSEKVSRPVIQDENQNIKSVVSLVDVVIEEAPQSSSSTPSTMPFIFCDEEKEEEDEAPVEKVPKKRRRNSLIPKKTSTDVEKKPLAEHTATRRKSNAATDTEKEKDKAGLLSKVMKSMPVTRASRKRMSLAGAENQPIPAKREAAPEKKEVLRPLRSSTRRSSTSVSSSRVLRNL